MSTHSHIHGQVVWSPGITIETMVQQSIEAAMKFYKGNKTAAAQSLGIAIRTLDTRLARYQKEKEEHASRVAEAQRDREELLRRQRGTVPHAQFDTAATPSAHTAAIEAKRRALHTKEENG